MRTNTVSENELNEKVAKLCPTLVNILRWHPDRPVEITYKGSDKPFDPCNDLNACHAFWDIIRVLRLWDEYCTHLEIVVRGRKGVECHKIFFYCAEADEHCVAFVKTMENK